MIAKVDRKAGYVVFKVVTPKGKLVAYRVLPEGVHDASQARDFTTLQAAREWLGLVNVFPQAAAA